MRRTHKALARSRRVRYSANPNERKSVCLNERELKMKKLIILLFAVGIFISEPAFCQGTAAPTAPVSERHEFVIQNFKTESGATLPEAHIVYGTYGTLNAAKDNAILLPSHYMAKYRGYEWIIGPGKALD